MYQGHLRTARRKSGSVDKTQRQGFGLASVFSTGGHMDTPSTWIVAPNYLAMIVGFDAIEVGVRKAHLIKGGKRVLSAFYGQQHKPGEKSFTDWVTFITNAKA